MRLPRISYIKNRVTYFAEPVSAEYHISLLRLYLDCAFCWLRYGTTAKDYFLYQFYLKNRDGRKQFLTGCRMDKWFEKNNDPEMADELKDKEKSLVRFGTFVKRDWCGQKFHHKREEYDAFAEKYGVGMVKPIDNCGGHRIKMVDISGSGGMADVYTLCRENNFILEEVIRQHEQMNKLYPHSVNTLRVVTFRREIIGCVLRIGAGGSEVDNASSGGMYAEVNIDNGIIMTSARNYLGQEYFQHPDTKVSIIGFSIPMWEQCKEIIEKAGSLTDGVPLVGWDVAVTPDGPVLVEVNERPDMFLLQHPRGRGMRSILAQ